MTNEETVALATAKARGLDLTPAGRANLAELAKTFVRIAYPFRFIQRSSSAPSTRSTIP